MSTTEVQKETAPSRSFDFEDAWFVARRKAQIFKDKITFYPGRRWIAFAFVLCFFLVRMYNQRGYAMLAYLLGLTYLQLVFKFLAPKSNGENDIDEVLEEGEGFSLPVRESDEYKGFQRKLGEMELWLKCMVITVIIDFLSCFKSMDVEVYVPILVFYFVVVTVILCRRKIAHMSKHKYVPFEVGKKSYTPNRPEFAQTHFK